MDGKLRSMTAVYLLDGDDVLLLWRTGSRVIEDSYTGTAGGHFEPEEIADARRCALRELQEETGLTEADIFGLTMRYVTLRYKNGEIRQNYYFFARLLRSREGISSNEGTLVWAPLEQVNRFPMPFTAQHMMAHYISTGRYTDALYGGVTTKDGVTFTEMEAF